jgi:hypothetical protein
MARYHFHVRYEGRLIEDNEGQNCADLAAAKEEALASVRELAIEAIKKGGAVDGDQIEIVDEHRKIVATVRVRSVVG